jgi:hypothetical protein
MPSCTAMEDPFAALAREIREVRAPGIVTLRLETIPCAGEVPDTRLLDAFVRDLGFRPPGDGWVALDRGQAAKLFCFLLVCELRHLNTITDLDTAERLVDRFFGFFGEGVRCYSNGTWHEAAAVMSPSVLRGAAWTPLTPSEFDTGVVCLDGERLGIFWVQDGDGGVGPQ